MPAFALVLALGCSFATEPSVIPLWENRPDREVSFIGPNDTERRVKNITRPTLTIYLAEKPNGTGVVIAPGGGFRHLAIDKEGYDVAKWFNTLGVSAFVLKYSAGTDDDRKTVIERSMSDTWQALKIVRSHIGDWKLNPARIGVMGFSAGGYLAADAALKYDADSRPGFLLAIYPAAPPDLAVPADAPPAFFAAASDDKLTPDHIVKLYTAWIRASRKAEMHLFTNGGHGFGIRRTGVASDTWNDRLRDWLDAQGLLK